MMGAASTAEMPVNFYQPHGTTTQKTEPSSHHTMHIDVFIVSGVGVSPGE
jgi:hypothetical protein